MSNIRQKNENGIISLFVEDAIKAGYAGDVYDGTEYMVRGSTDQQKIMDSLRGTDHDRITFRREDTKPATILCVYGNDPFEVIADYNDAAEPFLERANKQARRLEMAYIESRTRRVGY